MPLFINTNISSLNAQRQLNQSGMEMEKSMERLSSGLRVNSASDDAAGLAISNRQTSQIRGLDQAVRNANDGISLIQTAEGALSESTNILQRMRELSIQSANGIYSDTDRATLDAEVQQLVSELDRIATSTSFNGQNILDGSLGEVDLQVGAQSNQTIGFSISAVDSSTLGMGSLSADVVSDTMNMVATGTGLLSAGFSEQDVLINGQAIGAVSTGSNLQKLMDNINDNVNGVTVSSVAELNMTSVGDGIVDSSGVNVTIRGTDGNAFTFNVANTETLQEFADAVSAASGGVASASLDSSTGKLSISAQDASVISVDDAGNLGGSTEAVAKLVLASENGDPITIERGATGTLTDIDNLGFRESDTGGTIESIGLQVSTNGANKSLTVGELSINGVTIDHTDSNSLAKKIDNINDVSDQTGVTATSYSQMTIDMSGFTATTNADQLTINGIAVDLAIASNTSTAETVVTSLNALTDDTGVSARLSGTRIILESNEGAINIAAGTTSAVSFFGTTSGVETVTRSYINSNGGFVESSTAVDFTETYTALAGLKLESNNGNPISIELKDGANAAAYGLKESNELGEGSFGSALSSISIATQTGAQKAIDVIDNALETVNEIRSDLGAANNRLDFTISNLSNVSENTSAARARITDADFASETAALSRAQVLQQASQAMLAQANARPQQVLSLLQ